MASTPQPPFHRVGVRFTSDPNKNREYIQQQFDEDYDFAYRGELFLNEGLDQMYYVDVTGVARKFGQRDFVDFARIDFTGVREFADDADAAAATPPIEVGGLYHTAGVLKIRLV